MTSFFALLRLQLLSRYADLKPKNLKNALLEKRGRTIGMMIAVLGLVIYLGVILYIIETKALDMLVGAHMADLLLDLVVMLSTAGTLVMAFFFIMSSLYLGRDAVFLASMPISSRTVLGAKLAQVWLSETLIDAVIILPACILYGTRVGVDALFYVRTVIVWLAVAILPICIAAFFSAFLIRLSALWKHREAFMTIGGIALFVIYMIVMMNVGGVTGDSAEGGEMVQQFFMDNSARIAGMTQMFPPAAWAVRGLMGDWGQLALFVLVSAAAMALLIAVLGIFYRRLSMLQSETPQAQGKKGIQQGSIRETSAFKACFKRELKTILRVPSYAINILPVSFLPVVIIVMMGTMIGRSSGSEGSGSMAEMLAQLNPSLIMCILAGMMAYMGGMNSCLSTAVTREGRGHEFIKALPVSARTLIHAKLAVGGGLEAIGFIAAGIALVILMPGFIVETILAVILCLVFGAGTAFIALSRDVKKPKLDWVTEQEAVKQNYGVLFSMLISWAILIAVAGLCYFMITWEWSMEIIFAVLLVVLLGIAAVTYRHLMKNVDRYYCAG